MNSVCVHGLGYIGLPTATMLANYDHRVFGFDTDRTIRQQLRNNELHFDEPGLRAFVTQARESGNFELVDEVVPAKYHIICVPTPFDAEQKEADLSFVKDAGTAVSEVLRAGDSVILESTVPPGTTQTVLRPLLEQSGLYAGTDFALAHCPETVLPGNIIAELRENSRIIGGINGLSTESAVRLYASFVDAEIHSVSNPTLAEFIKLIQNTYRDVNIALANELAKIASDVEVSSRKAIGLANHHPRVNILQPGPGVGGHCLPIDPWFLGMVSNHLHLIESARQVNDSMPKYVTSLLQDYFQAIDEIEIAILGISYKGNIADTRNSPGLALANRLTNGLNASPAKIKLCDPYVTDSSFPLHPFEEAVSGVDALIITADHDEFSDLQPASIPSSDHKILIIDTKAVLDQSEWNSDTFEIYTI